MEPKPERPVSMHYNPSLDLYLKSIGERCYGLSLLHKSAEHLYDHRRMWLDLPCIFGSSILAFLNAGSSIFFEDPKVSNISLGVGSLVVGITQTVSSYFGFAKLAEAHHVSSTHYSKLYRLVSLQLSMPTKERMPPQELLQSVKDSYDRLHEISPLIPKHLVDEFKKKYDTDDYRDISKPEITNGLERIQIIVQE